MAQKSSLRTPVPAAHDTTKTRAPLTGPEIGYVAAAVDTGGTVSVHVTRGRGRRDRGRIYVIPLIKVSNTHLKQIAALHHLCGGSTYAEKSRKGYKGQWGWSVTGDRAVALLEKLRPHLLVKRALADVVLLGACQKARGKTTQADLKKWVATVRALNSI